MQMIRRTYYWISNIFCALLFSSTSMQSVHPVHPKSNLLITSILFDNRLLDPSLRLHSPWFVQPRVWLPYLIPSPMDNAKAPLTLAQACAVCHALTPTLPPPEDALIHVIYCHQSTSR
ncbi:hypothetical protein BDQ12DRAFT_729869 [Crucibulum laeve]|uniref:Secreted protein n=1 Tax=Crucibulum laeve TaxID=68775 RepID=A0A5C3LGT4_9AGAR|nr:hypothetical protein BDQ12DRAFT_729869 [Crucibulum laeve]